MYNRISIVGGSGSGKSTLCNILSKELNLPAIHLDAINYNANWVEIDKTQRDEIILNKSLEDKWIIDGNYNKTIAERFNKADLIIWLDYSTFAQLKGILVCNDKILTFKKQKDLNNWLKTFTNNENILKQNL